MSSSDNPLAFKNILSGIIVTVVGGVILAFIIRDAIFASQVGTTPTPKPTATLEEMTPTNTAPARTLTPTPAPTLTPTPPVTARFSDFALCPRACKQNEDTRVFPDGTKKIYAQWRYENVPAGAHYVRSLTLQGMGDWVKYECIWPGPAAGQDQVVFSEPQGFHSGNWEMTISIDDTFVLQETFVVQGNNQDWSPIGMIASCSDR
jgi:hypothetical protein